MCLSFFLGRALARLAVSIVAGLVLSGSLTLRAIGRDIYIVPFGFGGATLPIPTYIPTWGNSKVLLGKLYSTLFNTVPLGFGRASLPVSVPSYFPTWGKLQCLIR